MGLFNQFPFTNFHEMNLDWLINEVKTNEKGIYDNKTNIEKINKEIAESKKGMNDSQYINIKDFIENTDNDITDVFYDLYNKGYRYFYFPEGTYHIKFHECIDFNLKGDGKDKTIIKPIPNKYLSAMYIDTTKTNIKMEGFTLASPDNETAKSMYGFRVVAETGRLDLSTFIDVKFTGFIAGFICEGRAIWNTFYNCEFYGNYGDGLKVDVNVNHPFNNNTFYSCRFSNNRNYGIYMKGNNIYASLNTVFSNCNIEKNGYVFYEWGGSDSQHTLFFKYINSVFFNGCYFEHNSQSDSNAVVWYVSESEIYINNSTIVTEWKPIFTGDSGSVFISDSYGIGNQSTLTKDSEYANFSVITNCYQFLDIKESNNNIGIQVSTGLNFTKTNIIRVTGTANIFSVKPSTITQPVYIVTGETAPYIESYVMGDNNRLTLEPNSTYSFFLLNGKLYRIK